MRHNFLRHRALLLIAFGLWGSAAVHAQCSPAILFADLKMGFVANGDPALFDVLVPPTPSTLADCRGWQEMVVKVNIPKNCTAAIVDTDYEGVPRAWTLNIGDSPTNDGFSGDYGTTAHNAELWILDENLWLANAGNSPSLIDDPLFLNHLSLTDSAMKFLVKDQFVSWGQPYQYSQSSNNKLLFAVPDTTMTTDQRSIYVGLNRVIFTAVNPRTGCGLRTVVIRLQ